MTIEGTCDEQFSAVREAFAGNFVERDDTIYDEGASVAVTVNRELVVDLWGGSPPPMPRRLAVGTRHHHQRLVHHQDRGGAGASSWPTRARSMSTAGRRGVAEFAAGGKGEIEIRHLMSHTSGCPAGRSRSPSKTSTIGRRPRRCSPPRTPWWEPDTASGYHALTQGHLMGEVMRRVTGQTPGEFLAEEVTGPLGADFHIGPTPRTSAG